MLGIPIRALLVGGTLVLGGCMVVPPRHGGETVSYFAPAPRVYYVNPGYAPPPRFRAPMRNHGDWGPPSWGRQRW